LVELKTHSKLKNSSSHIAEVIEIIRSYAYLFCNSECTTVQDVYTRWTSSFHIHVNFPNIL